MDTIQSSGNTSLVLQMSWVSGCMNGAQTLTERILM